MADDFAELRCLFASHEEIWRNYTVAKTLYLPHHGHGERPEHAGAGDELAVGITIDAEEKFPVAAEEKVPIELEPEVE